MLACIYATQKHLPSGFALRIPTSVSQESVYNYLVLQIHVRLRILLRNMEGIFDNLSSLWDLTDLIISKDIVSVYYFHY